MRADFSLAPPPPSVVHLSVPVLTDLRVSGCYGLFVPSPSPGHITMATVDEATTLAVDLAYSGALDEARGAAVQVGLQISLTWRNCTSCEHVSVNAS